MIASMRAAVAGPTVAPQAIQTRGGPLEVRAMRGGHVCALGGRVMLHVAAHVARHAPPVLKELDRGRRGAEGEPLPPELPGDGEAILLELDVRVDVHLPPRAEGEFVR